MSKHRIISPIIEKILEEDRENRSPSLETQDIYENKIRNVICEMEDKFMERIERGTKLLQSRFQKE